MAEILKEWLTSRLQQPITWESATFGNMMKNGLVIASVLHSYHIINEEEYFMIRSGNDPEDISNNWQYIIEWLRGIEVYLTPTEVEGNINGSGSSLLRLFYQLFLQLDKRDRTNFIKGEQKKVSELVEKLGHRFKVERVTEVGKPSVEILSRPLLNEKHFIEWQKKKVKQVKDTYDFIRHRFSKMTEKNEEGNATFQRTNFKTKTVSELTKRERKEMETFALKYPCKFENYTYEELIALEKKSLEHRTSISSLDWVQSYMSNLYNRINKKSDSKEFQEQLRNVISGNLWNLSVAEEETKLDNELAKKVMKLSQFEKQMCTQIMETKQQARNLIQNRRQAEKEFAEQREHQFNQFLDNVKEQIHLEITEIDFEKRRQDKLHKKLYDEKTKRKRHHYYEICYDTMLSIVDYTTKYGYFKKLIGDEIPNHFIHEWKTLYFKQQPIFDLLDPMEDLLTEQSEHDTPPQIEEIVRLELDRQEQMNENEFNEYHNYSYPWTLDLLIPNYDSESEERKYEYLGTRILGHVVYTLLEIKYPYPPSRPPAELPQYTAKAFIRGLPDRSITTPMQILLNKRKIHVVRLETAINFCLRQFKNEMIGCTDTELSFDKFIAAAHEEDERELIRLMKFDDEILNRNTDLAAATMLGIIPPNTKQTQTPKVIPEEEICLTSASELGRYAYESLHGGEILTDHLLAAIIVEYLKDQTDINGFVIINYPNSYRQAQILEETFLGNAPPDEEELDDRDDIYLEESIVKHRKNEQDRYKDVRISRLVNDPHKKRVDKPFESYFTCYIHLKYTVDILQENFIWDLAPDNSEFIDRFYAVMGINYSMYYEIIDKELLAQICKYIIGDLIIPSKSFNSLFGDNVLNHLDLISSVDKRAKSRIIKPDVGNGKSRERLREGSKISKSSMINEFMKTISSESSPEKLPEGIVISETTEMFVEGTTFDSIEDIKMLPGQEDWEYAEMPISEHIGIALANCWEEVEKSYIQDMKQLFFSKRLQMNKLIPYTRYINDKMEQIIMLPSQKQDLVYQFQKDYNDFENDWLDINLSKNEWHCRVKQLQNKLYQICDDRKLYAEQQKHNLICDNWAAEELTTMANTVISCMQTELNRSIMTFQALHDFYFSMIKRMLPNDRLSTKELIKIHRDVGDPSGSRKGSDDRVYKQLKFAFQELLIKNINIDYANNPFNFVIENNVKLALKIIKDTNDSYRSLIAREYGEIVRQQPTIRKKNENTSEESIKAEENFKHNALKGIEEWKIGINGEMFRASLRILALQYKCYRDMKLFNDHIYMTFMDIQRHINTFYMNEIQSVDRLCKYLQMAVECGKKIPESLVLEHDTFVVDPNLLQFTTLESPVDTGEINESVGDFDFKISHLAMLRSQFKIVGPTGIILQQSFIYLLQDFIFFGKESCEGSLFPSAWNHIDPEQIPKLAYSLFGDTVYVDWRDFLIYCLNIRFPTVDELLDVRYKFRCQDLLCTELIRRDDFLATELWYEIDFDSKNNYAVLRRNLIKHFLFELFETKENMMNYSAFLLSFCKNRDPIEGFAMALSMAVGKKICHLWEESEKIVCKLIQLKQYKDACLKCALKCASLFLDALLNRVVNNCEGVSLTELEYVPQPEEKEKRSRKLRSTLKAHGSKKIENTQNVNIHSARVPKTPKNIKSKLSQSTTDVKTTYVCPPCESETVIETKSEAKLEVEVHKSEIEEDPNLVYAVSQTVIWNVLRVCLPWHFVLTPERKFNPYLEQVTDLFKRLEVDTENGDIYVSRLVVDSNFCLMLHKVKKFTFIYLADEIRKIYK